MTNVKRSSGANKECSTIGHQSCEKLISSTFITPTQSAALRNICTHLTRSIVINGPENGPEYSTTKWCDATRVLDVKENQRRWAMSLALNFCVNSFDLAFCQLKSIAYTWAHETNSNKRREMSGTRCHFRCNSIKMTIFIALTAVRYIFRSGNALESVHEFPA